MVFLMIDGLGLSGVAAADYCRSRSYAIIPDLSQIFYRVKSEINRWMKRELSFISSTIGCDLLGRRWYNKINANITLGAAPLKDRKAFQRLFHKGYNPSIVSLIQNHEYKPHWLGKPYTMKDWDKRKFTVMRLPNVDWESPDLGDLEKGADFIHQEIRDGKQVYVHCLAGVSRSAKVVLCYLMKYGLDNTGKKPMSAEEAVKYVRSKRRIAVLSNNGDLKRFATHLKYAA